MIPFARQNLNARVADWKSAWTSPCPVDGTASPKQQLSLGDHLAAQRHAKATKEMPHTASCGDSASLQRATKGTPLEASYGILFSAD